MLITPFSKPPADRPARRTTGKLAQQQAQAPKPVDQPPTTPTGLGLAKLMMNPKLSLISKVAF